MSVEFNKLRYFYDYYKFHVLAIILLLYFVINITHGLLFRKDIILNIGLVNVNLSDQVSLVISDNFITTLTIDDAKVQLYDNLYIKNNPTQEEYEITYASHLKLLATINAQQLDIVIMDDSSLNYFSENDFLYSLDELSSNSSLQNHLLTIDDTSSVIEITNSPLMSKFNFNGNLYLGIIKNCSNKDTVLTFLNYLYP